ncbi:hypothetical protein [Actinomadura opuntiae]|uniref:hypothetical protein n=1 Tax=Actinomadura sp. OS1-43 TaxID=604315 RepID=UPI00255AF13E|nr:hypothetical protein [Actinomadura sp. OS1-43]MDL4816936.1 hypothetical protein [Actinomadura sp. OS1-43]
MDALEDQHIRRPSPVFLVEDAGGRPQPAPTWFVAWVRLGALAALGNLLNRLGERTVLAVSVPARPVAAAATAFGFCRQRFLSIPDNRCPSGLDRSLGELEPGMRVWLHLADRVLSGTFLGLRPGGQVHTSAGSYLAQVVEEVRVPPNWAALPDGHSFLAVEDPFLRGMLRGRSPRSFITSWNQDIVIVGSRDALLADLEERISPATPAVPVGTLASIVRPLDLLGERKRCQIPGWRSVLMSSRSSSAAWSEWDESPEVAVLDGSYAVSRWLEECRARLVIAVLDRTESGLEAAVGALEQERAFMDPIPPAEIAWEPPAGCELLAYRSRG